MSKNYKKNQVEMESDSDSDKEGSKTRASSPTSQSDPYKVKVHKTNKEGIFQPECCEIGLLPNLPTTIMVIGKSGSGKTNAVVELLTNEKLLEDTFDYTYLFTGVKPDKTLLEPLKIPKRQIFVDFTEEDVSNLMTKMENTVEKIGMEKCPSVLFLFDDILGFPKFLKSATMSKLVTTNRHMNITCIILSQYFRKLPPVIRTNASYLMVFPSSLIEIEKIADELSPPNMSKKKFIELIQYATKDTYNFFSMNTKTESENMCRKNFGKKINL